MDKICKSEGNVNEKNRSHQIINNCPIRKQVNNWKKNNKKKRLIFILKEQDKIDELERTNQLLLGELQLIKSTLQEEKVKDKVNENKSEILKKEIENLNITIEMQNNQIKTLIEKLNEKNSLETEL